LRSGTINATAIGNLTIRPRRPIRDIAGTRHSIPEGLMTKHSRYERERRATDVQRMKEVQAAWYASLPAATALAFSREVEAAQARVPAPHVDMAPGTTPNPPRPGREPKPPKDEQRSRRSY
jgi:hypothetical protein